MSKTLGTFGAARLWVFQGLIPILGWAAGGIAEAAGPDAGARPDLVAQGQALFLKEWTPGAPSRHGGDGLGPVYNDTSCVACHNLGGAGGAGPRNKNVDLLSATVTPTDDENVKDPLRDLRAIQRKHRAQMAERLGEKVAQRSPKGSPPDRAPLIKLHAGFGDAPSVVLHLFGVDPDYERWRIPVLSPDLAPVFARRGVFGVERELTSMASFNRSLAGLPVECGDFTLVHTQRNPSPLFGVGLIDAIPDSVLESTAGREHPGFPAVRGRVHRLEDGRIGRFGWKAQAATLDDFVLTACAVELGLEVPGHSQAQNPRVIAYRAPGLDLTRVECDALTSFVRSLPTPVVRRPQEKEDALRVLEGRLKFEAVGCATCHAPRLGTVDGIYSDLLIHDMGEPLSDSGIYGALTPGSESDEDGATGIMPNGPLAFKGARPAFPGPSRREWRTPPLWGVRDSGPYLHDGRAETLEHAIVLHGGQAELPKHRYFLLSAPDRQAVEMFLKSLVAPTPATARPAQRPERERPEKRSGDVNARLVSGG